MRAPALLTAPPRALWAGASLLVALVVVAAVGLAVTDTALFEVLARGELVPYSEREKVAVRVLGIVTLYVSVFEVEREDAFTALALMGVAGAALAVACMIWAIDGARRARLAGFYALIAAAAAWLSLDETLSLHELIGQTFERRFGMPPLVHKPDDAVFALYAIPAAAFVWIFRGELWRTRALRRLIAVGAGAFVALLAADLIGLAGEEILELVVAAIALAVLAVMARGHLSDALRSRAAP